MDNTSFDGTQIERLRYGLTGLELETKLLQILVGLKAGFRYDQPRVPAGNTDGGQWTDEGGSSKPIRIARRRAGNGQVRVGSRWLSATSAQQLRMNITENAMRSAVREAKRLDPKWRPRDQWFETVEGQIRANEAVRLEAELRILELTGLQLRPGPFARE